MKINMQQKPFLSSDMIESASWKWNKWKLIPNPRTWTISNSDLLLVLSQHGPEVGS